MLAIAVKDVLIIKSVDALCHYKLSVVCVTEIVVNHKNKCNVNILTTNCSD